MKKTYSLIGFLMFMTFILSSCGGSSDTLPPPTLKAFVTSASGNGDLSAWTDAGGKTGVAAGDNVCQTAANAAHLSGTYKAWLSDSTTDAYCHVQNLTGKVSANCGKATLPVAAGPWVRTHDGFPFAPTIDKLVDIDQVYYPVRYDENGTSVTNLFYWTGTGADGTYSFACTDWTIGSGGGGQYASPDAASFSWTAYGGSGCGGTYQLLCLQTGAGASLPAITAPPSSKKVFVTSTTHNGNLSGLSGADAICQARAGAIVPAVADPSKFKAWLSDSGTNAIDRFATTAGPWYRLDGVKVADNKAALAASGSTPLLTAITVTETGDYLTNFLWVWSGTDETGTKTSSSLCLDWGDGTSSNNGNIGLANLSNTSWTNWDTLTCDNPAALYCFEDN